MTKWLTFKYKGAYKSVRICTTASSVSEKIAIEPIVFRTALLDVDVDTETLEKAKTMTFSDNFKETTHW